MTDERDFFLLLDAARLRWNRQSDRYLIAANRLMIGDAITSAEVAAIEADIKQAIADFMQIAAEMQSDIAERENK